MSEESPQTETGRSLFSRPGFWSTATLGAVSLVLALIGIDVVAVSATQAAPVRPIVNREIVRVQGTPALAHYYLSVSPSIKPGPDGKLHDAFSVTDFHVQVGRPVLLTIDNTDNGPHSITSPAAGVNVIAEPGTHTYTMLVSKPGVYHWYCMEPCDPFSMSHMGYMQGTITAS